jgi:hypothetical protein
MDLKEIACEIMDWIHVTPEGTDVACFEHCNKAKGSIKGGTFLN